MPTYSDSLILENTSNDLNHSSKCTVLVVVAFIKEEKKTKIESK